MAETVSPLATPQDFVEFGSNAELVQNQEIWTPAALLNHMKRATRSVESRCERRLAPFTGLVESCRAEGVDIEQVGAALFPLDLQGALGRSTAAAYGTVNLVRDFWLREFPPNYTELWSYDITSFEIIRFWGDSQFVTPDSLEGPQPDSGHLRVQLGTFLPIGSTVIITYSGGYTAGVPDDLNLACVLQAIKLLLIGAEPELRKGMDTDNLDEELTLLLQPFARN